MLKEIRTKYFLKLFYSLTFFILANSEDPDEMLQKVCTVS